MEGGGEVVQVVQDPMIKKKDGVQGLCGGLFRDCRGGGKGFTGFRV